MISKVLDNRLEVLSAHMLGRDFPTRSTKGTPRPVNRIHCKQRKARAFLVDLCITDFVLPALHYKNTACQYILASSLNPLGKSNKVDNVQRPLSQLGRLPSQSTGAICELIARARVPVCECASYPCDIKMICP